MNKYIMHKIRTKPKPIVLHQRPCITYHHAKENIHNAPNKEHYVHMTRPWHNHMTSSHDWGLIFRAKNDAIGGP